MKQMSKKKTLILGISILVVCWLVCIVYLYFNQSKKREPTQQEIEVYAAFEVDWQSAAGLDGSDKEIILSMCTYAGEETIGDNNYATYTSDILGDYLFEFGEMTEIVMSNEGILYVQYYTPGTAKLVILGYTDEGLCEKSIYDTQSDILFYEQNGKTEVWTHFRNGVQFGS